jgi:hypothetical protein
MEVAMTYEQMAALENKLLTEFPWFDCANLEENEDGSGIVFGVDVDVDIDPMTGGNRVHGVDQEPVWKVSPEGEILETLYQIEDEE